MRKKYFILGSMVLFLGFALVIYQDYNKASSPKLAGKDDNFDLMLANIMGESQVTTVDKNLQKQAAAQAIAKGWLVAASNESEAYEVVKLDSNAIYHSLLAQTDIPAYIVSKNLLAAENHHARFFTDSTLKESTRKLAVTLGNAGVLGVADELLSKLLLNDSLDCEAQIWKGSFYTQRALLVSSPIDKTEWVQRGMREMDLASEIDPNNYEVRIVRGLTFLSLPPFFETQEKGKQDIQFLLEKYDSNFTSQDRCKVLAQVVAIESSLKPTIRNWADSLNNLNNCK